jgi:lipoprotein Spr
MKNLFFVSVAFSIFSGTSLSADAQQSVKFINGIELTPEANGAVFTTYAPVQKTVRSKMLTTTDEKMPAETEMCTPLQFKYAQLLNKEVEAVTNTALFEFIDEWYGTRYRYGGTTKKGIDCSSLTAHLMSQVYSMTIPRTAKEQYAACTKIADEELAEGDLVFFNTRGGVSHVGLYLGEGCFVHASSSAGVTISHLDETYFKNRYIGAGRINPVAGIDIAKILL